MKLWPYLRGYMPRKTLGAVWLAVEEAGDWDKLFWWDDAEPTPFSTKGDLTGVVEYLTDPMDTKLLLIGEHEDHIAGITWFHEFRANTCQSGIWVAPKHRGVFSRQLINDSMAYLKALHGIETVYAVTPWVICRNLCRKTSFVETHTERDQQGRTLYHLTRELRHEHG